MDQVVGCPMTRKRLGETNFGWPPLACVHAASRKKQKMQSIPSKTWNMRAAVLILMLAGSAGLTSTAEAFPSIRNAWKAQYPGSTTDDNVQAGTGAECQICHRLPGGGNGWNPYGWQVRQGVVGSGLSATDAIIAAEVFDSDLDPTGSTNIAEINAGTQPGWTPGASNTIFFKNGTTLVAQSPPPIAGDLDPTATPVPIAGPWAQGLLVLAMGLLGSVALRRRRVA